MKTKYKKTRKKGTYDAYFSFLLLNVKVCIHDDRRDRRDDRAHTIGKNDISSDAKETKNMEVPNTQKQRKRNETKKNRRNKKREQNIKTN